MRPVFSLFAAILLTFNFSNASTPDTLIHQTKRVKGFGPIGLSFSPIKTMDKDNIWYSTVPKVKNIPDTLGRLLFATYEADFLQHTYQNYYMGNISDSFFIELKKIWDWHPDTVNFSRKFVKVNIAVAAGVNNKGDVIVVVDRNNNYDLGDDEPFKLQPKLPGQSFWGRYNDNLPIEVGFEYFHKGKIHKAQTWMYIDYSLFQYMMPDSLSASLPPELSVAFAEHRVAEVKINDEKYKIAVKSMRAVYRNSTYLIVITQSKEKYRLSDKSSRVNLGDMFKLGDTYYRFADVSIDGKEITLIKESDAPTLGGSQVGLKAINFVAHTISGEKISLENLRGKYVYLDFWGTWCSPCRREIPGLKKVYKAYKDKNFILLGIAKDKLETLVDFVEKEDIQWPQIVQDESKEIINLYNVKRYPTSFLIDPEGTIIEKNLRAEDLNKKLKELLK